MISISMKTQINAPAADVWAVISDFNALPKYVAAAVESKVDGEGIGAVRTLTLPDGALLQERLEQLDTDEMFLQYSIVDGPLPVADYLSTMKLTAAEEGCELEWSGDFNAAGASDEDARETMAGIYQMGFDGLAKLFA
ncbi:SRPBCC family protein [Desulfogranum marinum]|uniref:SRPBCC family protein n=1 Tax=Desulfogranum marinum TaxID=453220 RepID=UPI001964DD8E|nr:SRPBCC family protein [Desulfogranum marinum]MBM9513687.1 SRPBCC family protein [Desulfogranum marinum]